MLRRLAPVLIVCLAALLAPAPAGAAFRAVTAPPAPVDSFAASGSVWAVTGDGFPAQAFVSHDGGSSWQEAALADTDTPTVSGALGVAPDGAFHLLVHDRNGTALLRMAPQDQAFARLPFALAASESATYSAPAWDAQGRMWVAVDDDGALTVGRVAPDGQVLDQVHTSTGSGSGAVRLKFAAGRLYVDSGGDAFQLAAGSLRQISGPGQSTFGSNFPVFVAGRTVLSENGLSTDGGTRFLERLGETAVEVHDGDKLVVSRGFQGDDGGRLLTLFGGKWLRPTALTVPLGTESVWQTTRGLVAVGATSAPLALHTGAVPAFKGDRLKGVAGSMLARANFFRRQAGLPPFLGDRLIAKASANHARYWARRALPRGRLLDVHGETPGTRGFTGRTPQARCRHLGGDCGGEVMNFGNQARRPVDSWVATYYHRVPIVDPTAVTLGAARAGNLAVMDFGTPRGLALAPVGFPVGRYRGPLAFPGNESPDPLAACRAVKQPIGNNPSIPVTFQPPVGTAGQPVVRLFRGKRAVPGCTKIGAFMGRSPLARRTRYTAKARWQPAGGGPAITTTWSFRTP